MQRKTWKWFECYVILSALWTKTVLILIHRIDAGGFGGSFFILHRSQAASCCEFLFVYVRKKLHHPELSQTCPRNSELDDWSSWRQNLINVQSPSPENWTDFLGLSVNELVCLYLDKRHDAIIHLAIQPILLQCSSTHWRTKMTFSRPCCASIVPVLLCG